MSTANWIKLRVNVWDKAEVQYIAESCGIPIEQTVGILCRLWTWFDQHTEKGVTNKFGTKMVGKYTRTSVTDERDESVTNVMGVEILVTPFLEAMQEVEWIKLTDEGFWALTNWEEHNGETAKTRASNQKRQAKSRANKEKDNSVTEKCDKGVTREEKRREEKNRKEESVVVLKSEAEKSTHTQNSANANKPQNIEEVYGYAEEFFKGGVVRPSSCRQFFDKWESCDWLDSNLKPFNWKMKFGYFVEDEVKPKVVVSKKNEHKPIIPDYHKAPVYTDEELEAFEKGAKAIELPWSKAE